LDRAAAWLGGHQPPERPGQAAALLHNDYKYDNLVLHPGDLARIVAVLDWEMATVGDPLMDLGTSLGYWMDPDDAPELRLLPAGPTTLPGNLRFASLIGAVRILGLAASQALDRGRIDRLVG
jgi:aminoglycoside phosphotransferase (APT) family kinase protein